MNASAYAGRRPCNAGLPSDPNAKPTTLNMNGVISILCPSDGRTLEFD